VTQNRDLQNRAKSILGRAGQKVPRKK